MPRFRIKMKLGRALWGAFGLLLLLAAGQSAIVVSKIAAVQHAGGIADEGIAALTAELGSVETSATESAKAVSDLASRVQTELASSMETGEAEMQILLRNVVSTVEATSEIVNRLEEMLDSGDLDDDTAGAIEELLFDAEDSADAIRKTALPLVRAGVDRLGVTAAASHKAAEEIAGLTTTMDQFAETSQRVAGQAGGVSQQIERSTQLAGNARWLTIGAAGLAIALGIAVPTLLVPRVSQEVARVVGVLEGVAGGDLSKRLRSESFNEFSRIATALNGAVESMDTAVAAIRGGSTRLASSSDALNTKANSLTDGAEATTELSMSVAAAAEEMSSSMSEIAASVEQVSSSNSEISAAAEKMVGSIRDVSDRVTRAVTVTDRAAQLIESGSERIGRLGDAAGEISEVSQVIQDIADMTNLLALNATIEAARAGEAGKGFAVVATEVKELAKQTSQATEQIRQRIDSIQSASDEAVDLVSQIDGVIGEIREEAEQVVTTVLDQDETTQQIAAQITEASTAGGVVAENVSQTAAASGEIARSISKVDAAARSTATVATETRASGDELLKLSHELDGALAVFQTPA